MPVGAADGDDEGIKLARCLAASGAKQTMGGVKKGRFKVGVKRGRHLPEQCTRCHCGKLATRRQLPTILHPCESAVARRCRCRCLYVLFARLFVVKKQDATSTSVNTIMERW